VSVWCEQDARTSDSVCCWRWMGWVPVAAVCVGAARQQPGGSTAMGFGQHSHRLWAGDSSGRMQAIMQNVPSVSRVCCLQHARELGCAVTLPAGAQLGATTRHLQPWLHR